MLRELKDSVLRLGLAGSALAFLLAFASFYLIQAVVQTVIAPLIAAFVGDPIFEGNSFTIRSSEIHYGILIEYMLVFVLAVGLVAAVLAVMRRSGAMGTMRDCPECTSAISSAAKRCPRCTAVVQPVIPR